MAFNDPYFVTTIPSDENARFEKSKVPITWDIFDLLDKDWDESDGYDYSWDDFGNVVVDIFGLFNWGVIDGYDRDWDYIDDKDLTWDEWFELLQTLNILDFTKPTLRISFTQPHSSAGLTFKFLDDVYATDMLITWWDQHDEVLARRYFYPESDHFHADQNVSAYTRIEISILGTSVPESYLRFEIDYGLLYSLSGNDIISANIHWQISAISAELYVGSLSFKTHSDTSDFFIMNPEGVFNYFQDRQRIKVTEVVDGEQIDMGTFYLDTIENPSESVVGLYAVDAMGVMNKSLFIGGVYQNALAKDVVEEIMESAGADYTLAPALEHKLISGHIPICTHGEALQLVAFSIGAIATAMRSDIINIYPQDPSPVERIWVSQKFYRQPVKLGTLITGVELTTYIYAEGGDESELLNDIITEGLHEVPFPSPMYNVRVTTNNAEIVKQSANYALINVPEFSRVIITGNAYVQQTRSISEQTPGLLPSVTPNVEYISDSTLVSPSAGRELIEGLSNHFRKRHTTVFGMITSTLSPGNAVQVDHRDGGQLVGTIEEMSIDLTGGFRSDITVNFASLLESTKYYYAGELYAGER